jgi:glycosyltransferase involved in cell wall biosynthesis
LKIKLYHCMLSIIVPTLNEENYLPLLLREIKKQNFKDYEVIVADASSRDKTVEIAESYGCKVVPGGSPAKGRNVGAKAAKKDIFLFMDADNIFLSPGFLRNLMEGFEKRKLDVASFPLFLQGNKFDRLAYGLYNWWVEKTQRFLPHATNCVLIRRNIHEKIGGFNEEIQMAEDHAYVRKAAKYGKFGFIKTDPVLTSSRRLERDGRFKTYFKYLLGGLHMILFGNIKSDIFKYRFNHYLKNDKKEI